MTPEDACCPDCGKPMTLAPGIDYFCETCPVNWGGPVQPDTQSLGSARDRLEPIEKSQSDRSEPIRKDLARLLDHLYGLHFRPGHLDTILEVINAQSFHKIETLIADWRERARIARPLEDAIVSSEKRERVKEWMFYTNRANELQAALDALKEQP